MSALSDPRLNSARGLPDSVFSRRIRVPFSLAVASKRPSGLSAKAEI